MKSATDIGRAILERLAAQAAANRAAGDRLRAKVRAVWEQHEGYTAKEVIRALRGLNPGDPIPSVRRVQEILKALRATSSLAVES